MKNLLVVGLLWCAVSGCDAGRAPTRELDPISTYFSPHFRAGATVQDLRSALPLRFNQPYYGRGRAFGEIMEREGNFNTAIVVFTFRSDSLTPDGEAVEYIFRAAEDRNAQAAEWAKRHVTTVLDAEPELLCGSGGSSGNSVLIWRRSPGAVLLLIPAKSNVPGSRLTRLHVVPEGRRAKQSIRSLADWACGDAAHR